MSQTKKFKFQIIFVLMLVCFFAFGCKNETPVEDIYFNITGGDQIVLIVGQTLDMNEYVVVQPSYATNKKYTLTSFNPDVVKVENNKLIALKADQAVIKVTSNSDPDKESLMTVIVKATQEQLNAPLNLNYNPQTKTLSFDAVLYASTYTLKLNGEEINLGNSTTYNLSKYSNLTDNLIIAQVKANAPTYSFALKSSAYSNEYKMYQAGEVSNLQVVGGIASFAKSNSVNKHNVYVNGTLFANEINENTISLNNLQEIYAGSLINVSVESLVSNEIKNQYGNDVNYFASDKKSVSVNVLDAPNLRVSASQIGWQNIAHSAGYEIYIQGVKKAETTNNYFDLQSLNNYDDLFLPSLICEIKVAPILSSDSKNVAKSSKESLIKVERLSAPTVVCAGTDLTWSEVENASVYAIKLAGNNVELNSSTATHNLSMKPYLAGVYNFEIYAVANEEANADNVYFLSSKTTSYEFEKLQALNADIENYVLNISNFSNKKAKLDFDVDDLDAELDYSIDGASLDLGDYQFEAGEHSITLINLGDNNHIDSDETKVEFVQLEKIEEIEISNSIVSVERSAINNRAKIVLQTEGGNLTEPIIVENTGYFYNSESVDKANYLEAGNYVTKVFVMGDGSSTLSYRENGEVVANTFVEFEVLKAPKSEILDTSLSTLTIENVANVSAYSVYTIIDETYKRIKDITSNEFNFVLSSGSVTYAVQAIGDGVQSLNSVISAPVTITKLETPKLQFNNTNNFITKTDVNDALIKNGDVFTHNGEVNTKYDFNSAFNLSSEENVFTLTTLAAEGENNQYYLNSNTFTLTLNHIANNAEIKINDLDNLIEIDTKNHIKEYELAVEFDLSDGIQTFYSVIQDSKYVLTNGLANPTILNYIYSNGKYYISIIDDNYNAIINSMNNEFSVRVKFVEKSTGDDRLINSDFGESFTLNLVRINAESQISVNTNNQIVLANDYDREFAIVAVAMLTDSFGYIVKSNGNNELVCDEYIQGGVVNTNPQPVSISYEYNYNRVDKKSYYYINILDENKECLLPNVENSFDVKVKYSFLHNGVETDLDSDYSEEQTIAVQAQTNIVRDGQNIKISNVKDTYTYLNYSLLVNGYELALNSTIESVDGFIVVGADYIFNNTPSLYLQDVNLVEVIVKNNETSAETPVLSRKSGEILISKTNTVEVLSYKFNDNEDGLNNNSTVVYFNTYNTNYSKTYVVELYNSGELNKITKIYLDENANNNQISFNMDDIQDIEGLINISVKVQTEDNYDLDGDVVYVFNSAISNVLQLTKIVAPTNIKVSDSRLSFTSVRNAVGYEVWQITGTGKIKLSNQLITSNFYDVSNISGQKQIAIKAISITGNFTNSSLSETITINKISQPTVSVVDGKFNLKLTLEILGLLSNENIDIIPVIANSSSSSVEIDMNNLDGKDIVLSGLNLQFEPHLFMSYNTDSLISEHLTLKIKVRQTSAVGGVYYLNSDEVSIDAYGLFAPTNVKKTTAENNTVEMISWNASDKNVLNGNDISVGYVFKIKYSESDEPFYSNDTKLKYFNASTQTYQSYGSYISSLSAIFPAGYDSDNDGELDIEFGAGTYEVSVQTIPLNAISGYNICNSKFSDVCRFEIMSESTLSVEQGLICWEENPQADYYTITIYEQYLDTPLFVDTTENSYYELSNTSLNDLTGVYKIVVKSISTKDDVLNSANSEALYVYRLPQASELFVDDGHLILKATKYFGFAKIELIDTETNVKYELPLLDNSEKAKKYLLELDIEDWSAFDDDALINEIVNYVIDVDVDTLTRLTGGDYTFNVTLIGNDNIIDALDETTGKIIVKNLGFITSSGAINLSNLTATKLKPNVMEVDLGVVKFTPDTEYATISKEGVYTSSVNLNYAFNGVEPSSTSEFWKNTTLYKIVVTTPAGPNTIYALDYYSLTTAINNGTINASEYQILNGSYGIYAWVMYPYLDGETTKTLYFNVFTENKINLRDYSKLIHYSVVETIENGVNKFSCATTNVDFDLIGTITIDVYMMGGDSYTSGGKTIAHLTAKSQDLDQFECYAENTLSTYEGQVKFKDLTPIVDGKVIDNPVYKIIVSQLNSSSNLIFYIYNTTYEEAIEIARRNDEENYLNATYLKIGNDENTVYTLNDQIVFDLSQFITEGTYKATIQTLAGMGNGNVDADDYYINAKKPTTEYTFFKLTDTQFVANNGKLQFAQSYIVKDGSNIPYDEYEITIIDNDVPYTFNINKDTENVTIDSSTNVVTYILPDAIGRLTLVGGKNYSIKVRGKAVENFTLNGTYKKQDSEDYLFVFEKSLGISTEGADKLRFENGILKWKVLDLTNFKGTIIRVSFLDGNFKTKVIEIPVDNLSRYEVDGVYQYHYYQFTDEYYTLKTGGTIQLVDKIVYNYESNPREEIVNYTISVFTLGTTLPSRNIIDSSVVKLENDITRLSQIDISTIKTVDGNLSWQAVENATYYEVKLIGNTNYLFTTYSTNINTLVEDYKIVAGSYDVQIRAYGGIAIQSIWTDKENASGFVKLAQVDINSVEIVDNKIVWKAVENATNYKVVFNYTDVMGTQRTLTDDTLTEPSFTCPTGISGRFTIQISAISKGEGKQFNGDELDNPFESSKDAPMQVENFDFVNNNLIIDVKNENFLTGDKLLIVYDFKQNTSTGLVNQGTQYIEIAHNQAGMFEALDEATTRYLYPITIIGQYSNISVQVVRSGTVPSNAVVINDINFDLFDYGAGKEENPYRIFNSTHLLNIEYFPSAYYVLTSSISMANVDVNARLNRTNASGQVAGAIICEEFSGVIDGDNFSILNFNSDVTTEDVITLNGETNFALFKNITSRTENGVKKSAEIKNLTIGSENIQLILLNMFANQVENVVNLSLIASGANNLIIDNVKVLDFKMQLTGESEAILNKDVFIAGLIANAGADTIIKNSTINFSLDVGVNFNSDSKFYAGGAVANANNAQLEKLTVTFNANQTVDSLMTYFGGAVGYYIGNIAKTTGITSTDVVVELNNIKSMYLGGLVGFARYIKVDSSSTDGNYSKTNIDYTLYLGGVIGCAQGATITNSGTKITFKDGNGKDTISVRNVLNKRIGAIVGSISNFDNVTSVIDNCYMSLDLRNETIVTTTAITLGIYGYKDTSIENGYYYELN